MKKEITKRVFFSIILIIIFVPLFVITRYAGFTGRIISACVYMLLGMYVIYETLISLKIKFQISLFSSLVIPLFFLLPFDNFMSVINLNINTNYLHILSKKAILSWKGLLLVIIFSFFPLLFQLKNKINTNYFIYQFIITFMFIIISLFNKLFWVFNIKGIEIILFLILISIISDVGAYFGGNFFQGKKIAPNISPKKTYSGLFVGMFFSCIFAILYGYFFNIWQDFNKHKLLFSIVFGIILSLVSPIGDLYFSVIKRITRIKNFSNIIPGHGGFMDRLDSMSFVFVTSGLFMLFVYI